MCCCLWVVAGGAVAAYLLQQNQTQPITPGDGALVGLFAGIIGAGVGFVISIPIGLMMEPMQRAMVQRTLEMSGNMPPAVREILENYGQPRTAVGLLGGLFLRVIGFFFLLCRRIDFLDARRSPWRRHLQEERRRPPPQM